MSLVVILLCNLLFHFIYSFIGQLSAHFSLFVLPSLVVFFVLRLMANYNNDNNEYNWRTD